MIWLLVVYGPVFLALGLFGMWDGAMARRHGVAYTGRRDRFLGAILRIGSVLTVASLLFYGCFMVTHSGNGGGGVYDAGETDRD